MFDHVKPHLTLISDKKAKALTCGSFRTRPLGLEYDLGTGELENSEKTFARNLFRNTEPSTGLLSLLANTTKKFISTKTQGRVQFRIDNLGNCKLHIA